MKDLTGITKGLMEVPGLMELLTMPTKEFCKQLGLSKETEQYLEDITRKEAEKEKLSGQDTSHGAVPLQAKNITERYSCDEVMDDISFWEGLYDVIEEIDGMPKRKREKCLAGIIKREISKGKTWRRQVLKILLVDPSRREKLREAIKSGRIYDPVSA